MRHQSPPRLRSRPRSFRRGRRAGRDRSGCVVDSGPGYGYGGCQPDVFVDWQIQNPAGGAVTCDAVGAKTVVIDIDGADFPQTCPDGYSYGSQDILLQRSTPATRSR